MKFLKVFILFVLYFFNLSETIRFDEHENVLIIVNNLITTKKDNWISIMNNRKIIIINQFQTIEEYFTRLFKNSESRNSTSSQTELEVDNSNILEKSSFMYTALNCEYAHLIRVILQHFLHYEDLFCQTISKEADCIEDILKSLDVLKKHLDKVIFNLFNFKELSLNIKSSDHTLTVLLLNMHMFLWNKVNITDNENKKIYALHLLKRLARYTIFSIENFICKKCLFEFTELDKTTNIRGLQISKSNSLDKYLSLMEEFSDIGLLNDEYFPDMYNQNNYLMIINAEKLNDITLKKSQPDSELKKITDIIQSIKQSYDLKSALKFQIFFIELLSSIFSVLIINVINNINNVSKEKTNDEEINILYNGFHKYTGIIPDNYPPTHLHSINEIKKAFEAVFQSLNSYNIESLNNIKDTLSKISNISETENSQIDIINIASINNFLVNIKINKHFPSFKQTFELFLQEPNILNDYHLLKETNNKEISANESSDLCSVLPRLRTGFVFFLAMLEEIKNAVFLNYVNECLKTIIDQVNDNIKKNYNSMVKRTLLDFLNYFTDPKFQSLVNINSSEFLIAKQLILGTVISLHFHEINNCKLNNITNIYQQLEDNKYMIRSDPSLWFEESETYIKGFISSVYGEEDKKDASKFNNDASISNDQNGRTSIDNIRRYSDFYKKEVLNVCQDLYQNIKIPDNHKMEKLQMNILEWYVSQAYAKVMCMFQFENVLPSEKIIVLVKENFKILKSLKFSTYFMRTIQEYINFYINYFEKQTINNQYITNFIDELNNQFEVYDVSIDEFKFNSIEDFYDSFKSDIEFIHFYFIDTNNYKFIVDEEDIPMSIFMDE